MSSPRDGAQDPPRDPARDAVDGARNDRGGRRQAFITATQNVLLRRGFIATTVSEITAEAGSSVGLLNYHFGSKDNVVAEAFRQFVRFHMDNTWDNVRRDAPAPERLARHLELQHMDAQDGWRTWTDAYAEGLRSAAMQETLRALGSEARSQLTSILADGVAAGDWECDPEELAAMLFACIDGFGLHRAIDPEDLTTERADAWLRRLFGAALGITLPRPAPAVPEPGGRSGVRAQIQVELPGAAQAGFGGTLTHAALVALLEPVRRRWLEERLRVSPAPPVLVVVGLSLQLTAPVPAGGPAVLSCVIDRLGADGLHTRETLLDAAGMTVAVARVHLRAVDGRSGSFRSLTPLEREVLGA